MVGSYKESGEPVLSIVTTMYRSAPYLKEFYTRIVNTLTNVTDNYEIIFVNDGSPDHSLAITLELLKENARIKIIELAKNFGHHKAMTTGLKYATGKYIFLIDCDLEEDPELLMQFWQTLTNDKNIDVVYGVQNQRKGGWIERWSGDAYFRLLNRLSDEVKIDKNISTIRLMKKQYVNELVRFQENIYYFGPITTLIGFNQKPIPFNKRNKKISSYGFLKKYHMFLDSIIAFSSKPLYLIFYIGTCITMASFSYMFYLILRKMVWGISMEGWTTLAVLISLFGGINIFFMGVISLYILHIFKETKNRPFSIIKQIYQTISPHILTNHQPTSSDIFYETSINE